MIFSVKISTLFECSLERAFKAPILCDVSKVHTGYGLMPRVTHCTDDTQWGQPGHSKRVYAAPSATQKGGWVSDDKVLERVENQYWVIEVSNFQSWMLGFYKFVGRWQTTELAPGRILIEYSYDLHTDTAWWYPLNVLFAQLFWRRYMRRVVENVRALAYSEAPYMYA